MNWISCEEKLPEKYKEDLMEIYVKYPIGEFEELFYNEPYLEASCVEYFKWKPTNLITIHKLPKQEK